MEFRFEKANPEDLDVILKLGESSNEEHVVPLLSADGKKAFRIAFTADINNVKDAHIYSVIKATVDDEIIGYVAWRDESYIGHLYVKTEYHGFGVARRLVEEMKAASGAALVRVKASIYALGFYKKVGFAPISDELSINGIRYVPMVLDVEQNKEQRI
ncbi:GNAT family N-acetyltransferase [Enterovibrio calviensis]|uniref:GNAT family N-acetyltransferase n=1 Tax=Enterovibrio calviensis TaxID=91359 RepID=UPI00373564DB